MPIVGAGPAHMLQLSGLAVQPGGLMDTSREASLACGTQPPESVPANTSVRPGRAREPKRQKRLLRPGWG